MTRKDYILCADLLIKLVKLTAIKKQSIDTMIDEAVLAFRNDSVKFNEAVFRDYITYRIDLI